MSGEENILITLLGFVINRNSENCQEIIYDYDLLYLIPDSNVFNDLNVVSIILKRNQTNKVLTIEEIILLIHYSIEKNNLEVIKVFEDFFPNLFKNRSDFFESALLNGDPNLIDYILSKIKEDSNDILNSIYQILQRRKLKDFKFACDKIRDSELITPKGFGSLILKIMSTYTEEDICYLAHLKQNFKDAFLGGYKFQIDNLPWKSFRFIFSYLLLTYETDQINNLILCWEHKPPASIKRYLLSANYDLNLKGLKKQNFPSELSLNERNKLQRDKELYCMILLLNKGILKTKNSSQPNQKNSYFNMLSKLPICCQELICRFTYIQTKKELYKKEELKEDLFCEIQLWAK